MQEERFLLFLLFFHEVDAAFSHAEEIDGVGIPELGRRFIAPVAVVHIVAVLPGPTPFEVPLAEMGSGVADRLQYFTDGGFTGGDTATGRGTDHGVVLCGIDGRTSLGPAEGGDTATRLQADASRGAHRCGGIGGGEAQTLCSHLFEGWSFDHFTG